MPERQPAPGALDLDGRRTRVSISSRPKTTKQADGEAQHAHGREERDDRTGGPPPGRGRRCGWTTKCIRRRRRARPRPGSRRRSGSTPITASTTMPASSVRSIGPPPGADERAVGARRRTIMRRPPAARCGPARGSGRRGPRSSRTGRTRRRPAPAAPTALAGIRGSGGTRGGLARPASSVPDRVAPARDRRGRAAISAAAVADQDRPAGRARSCRAQAREAAGLGLAAGDPEDRCRSSSSASRAESGLVALLSLTNQTTRPAARDLLHPVRQAREARQAAARPRSRREAERADGGVGDGGVLPVVAAAQVRERAQVQHRPLAPVSASTSRPSRTRLRPGTASAETRATLPALPLQAVAQPPGWARRRRRSRPRRPAAGCGRCAPWRRHSRPGRHGGRDGRA